MVLQGTLSSSKQQAFKYSRGSGDSKRGSRGRPCLGVLEVYKLGGPPPCISGIIGI